MLNRLEVSNGETISRTPDRCAGREDMEERTALAALAALAHETRLAVFRMLVAEGPSGLSAGEIAERVGVVASTLSFHLKELERAGLLRSWRRQRQIFYAADIEGTRGLLTFLTRDCCHGHPEICGDLARLASVPEPEEA
jgi:ArsR family transcriptional regulator, arsenate/arsenite/antimonite-responsive transcriptional repressor